MAMSINTNSSALTAQRNVGAANMRSSSSLAKLSSGSRVPSAKDDVAALAVGTKLKAEVAGLRQAQQNVGQGVSLLQIADGAMSTISDMLTRMKSLAVQASSGQLADADRALLNNEYSALGSEIDRVATNANFNGTSLLAGSNKVAANINDMGADNPLGNVMSVEFADTFGTGAISVKYDATADIMTVTNSQTQTAQSVSIGATAIGAGETQQVNFNSLGVNITLNDNFDKTTDIDPANTAAAVDGTNFTAGVIEAGSIAIEDITVFAGTASTTMDVGRFEDATIEMTGAAAATTFTLAAKAEDGSALSLTATVDMTVVGNKKINMADGNGNTVSIELNVTTAFAGTAVSGDGNEVELKELGTLVGAKSVASASTSFTFKVGTGTTSDNEITASLTAASFADLAGSGVGNVSTASGATGEISKLDAAINQITANRATVGAAQSRLEFAGASIAVAAENTLSAQSAMLDVDVSTEMTEFTSSQVLVQAGISMLAQANQQPALLLRLLQ